MAKYRSYFFIVTAAALWGIIAFFVKSLQNLGFTSMEIVTIRVTVAAILLLGIGLWKYRSELKMKWKHIPLFIGSGIFSIVFFNWCYFLAIEEMSISMAVILLYTAPAIVAVLSWLFLGEKMNTKKIISIVGTISGCVLITGLSGSDVSTVSLYGLLIGFGSALGYALYTIFGKLSLKHYTSFAITFYTFLTASIFLLPISNLWEKQADLVNAKALSLSLGLGLLPTVLAYILYTEGLKHVDSSIASILATIEPLVAVLLGIIVYKESLLSIQWAGALLILLSVIYVNTNGKLDRRKKTDIPL